MSRVYRVGTVYSRVEGLIRKGHLKECDRPIWYDVYRKFPPKYEPSLSRKIPEVKVREIFYEEDRLRAKIHIELHKHLGPYNLLDKNESKSQKWMKNCREFITKGMTEENAIKELKSLQPQTFVTI